MRPELRTYEGVEEARLADVGVTHLGGRLPEIQH